MESLGAVEASTFETDGETGAQSEASVSDPVSVTPGLNLLLQETEITEVVPQVTFLDIPGASSSTTIVGQEKPLDSNTAMSFLQPRSLDVTNSDAGQMAESDSERIGTDTASVSKSQMDCRSHTDDDSRFDMECETGSQVRSTLADALHKPAKATTIACPGGSSNESSDFIATVELGLTPLSGTSSNKAVFR